MKLDKILSIGTRKLAAAFAILTCAVTLTSCDGLLYEDEGDCDPHYKVRFRFDYNLKKADAFAQEVNAVTLYVVDPETDRVVWRKTESSDILKSEGYLMDVEGLAPGNYKLMAWAGDGHKGSPHFTLADEGDNHKELICTLNRTYTTDGTAEVTDNLHRLYKDLPEEFNNREFTDRQGTHIHTVRLMKNTNDITVVLQHLSGEPVDPSDFDFAITEANGTMNYDNSLLPDEEITYRPWATRSGVSEGFVPEGMIQAKFSAAIADFTVGRMMADRKMYLTITRHSDGGLVAKVPVIDYALMVKANYGDMPDQEYLDRQDHYSMVFFLDDGLRWLNTMIYINAWHVVLSDHDL